MGGGERGGSGGERRKLVERHWLGQCPDRPSPPIVVAVSADQSVVSFQTRFVPPFHITTLSFACKLYIICSYT